MLETLKSYDQTLLMFVNQDLKNPVFDWLMPFVSSGSYMWVPAALLVVYILWKGSARSRWMLAGAAFVVAVGDPLSAQIIKPLIGRPRPYALLDGLWVFKGHWMLSAAIPAQHTLSFPSNHAVNSTAVACVISWLYPRYWPLAALGALLVGLSRVYVGMHYPADVLAGALLGAGIAGLFIMIMTWSKHRFPDRFAWLSKEF